jgi:hypothetical protein
VRNYGDVVVERIVPRLKSQDSSRKGKNKTGKTSKI